MAGGPLLQAYRGPSNAKAFSSDGRFLATASKGTQVWDVKSGQLVYDLPAQGRLVTALVFSPDSSLLATSGTDLILIWDMASGQVVHRFTCCAASNMAFGSKGQFLYSAEKANRWIRWDLATGKSKQMGDLDERPFWLIFAPDGASLVARFLHKLTLWEPHSGKHLRTIETKANGTLVYSPDSRVLAISDQGKVYRWLQHNGEALGILILPDGGPIGKIAFSNDARFMAYLDARGYRVLDCESGQVLHTLPRNDGTAQPIFSPDGKMLILSGEDMVWWSTETGKQLRLFPRLFMGEGNLAFAEDGRALVFRGIGSSWNWDLTNCTPQKLETKIERVMVSSQGYFSREGARIASADGRLVARRVNLNGIELLEQGKTIRQLKMDEPLIAAALSENGSLLAASDQDGKIRVWETDSGKQHSAAFPRCRGLAFGPKGQLLALVGDETVLLDWRSGKPMQVLEASAGNTMAPVFSSDGKLVAASMRFKGLCLWRTADGKLVKTLPAFGRSLCFSPDSRQIAGDSGDGLVRVWDLQSQDSVTLLALADDSWLAWTQEGYYHGSSEARQRLRWRRDGVLQHEAALHPRYYRPTGVGHLVQKQKKE